MRAVLLTGAGRIFCGGGDLKSFAAQEPIRLPTHLKRVNLFFHGAIECFARMRAPLVVAVNGYAAGGGNELGVRRRYRPRERVRAFHDSLYASRLNAQRIFNLLLATNHRTPSYDGTGALTNRTLTAREAEAIGLVTRVVPDDQLIAQAEALGSELAHGPTRAYGGVKRLLYGTATNPLYEQMELENESIADMARSADAHEGINAFLAKRPPQFSGR